MSQHYTKRPFDKRYFQDYCEDGAYEQVFYHYSDVRSCIRMLSKSKWKIDSVAVLGAATGQVLEEFYRVWGIRPYGCELSQWAYDRIPGAYRRRIQCMDLRDYLPWLIERRRKVDLVFSNSLFYLPKKDVDGVLHDLAQVTRLVHFHPEPQGDPWVCIYEPYSWWQEKFSQAGFKRTRSAYLWRRSA